MRVAVVDIGSGSLSLSLGIVGDEGAISLLGEWALDTGLSDFSEEARERVLSGLKSFRHILRMQTSDTRLRAYISAALPEGRDRDQFVKDAQAILDHPVEVLTAGEESALSFLGSYDARAVPEGHLVVVAEIDGNATHLAVGDHEKLIDVFTIQLGATSLTDRFLGQKPTAEAGIALSEHLHEYLNVKQVTSILAGRPFHLVAAGPTMTLLAALEAGQPLERGRSDSAPVSAEAAFHWYQELVHVDCTQLPGILGVNAARARTLLAGVGILVFLMEKLSTGEVYVSDNARRHGALREILGFERVFQ